MAMSEGTIAAMQDDDIRSAPRLCFFAHYHPTGLVAEHVLIYLRALAESGFTVVVLSTARLASSEEAKLARACALLIRRENVGLDFGGWQQAVKRFFPIRAELLLLANDSVYAPVGDFAAFLSGLIGSAADFYGAIESLEIGRHLQSWFILLRPAAYDSPAFIEHMASAIPADLPKGELIATYEVGLTKKLVNAGLTYHAAYSPTRNGFISRKQPFNACHALWRELVSAGIPFLKIELLRDNPLHIAGLEQWPATVEKLNPALVGPIRDDLKARRSDGGVVKPVRWTETIDEVNPAYWSELQPLIRADFHAGDRWGPPRWLIWRLARHLAGKTRRVRRYLSRPASPPRAL